MENHALKKVSRVVIRDEASHEVLLLQRPTQTSYYPNHWELPGGKVDPGESFIDNAIREVAEETGLTLSSDTIHFLLRTLVEVTNSNSKYFGSIFLNLYFWTQYNNEHIQISEEHNEFIWVNQESFKSLQLTPGTLEVLELIFSKN